MAALRPVLNLGSSLYAQLLTLAAGLLVLALGGLLAIHVSSTHSLLTEQLDRHAQDTATALGLTLSRELASKDAIFLESIVDSAFDPGYFRTISVALREPDLHIDRQRPASVDGVPAWFVRVLSLPTPAVSARVMNGWAQAGEVTVVADPGLAYVRLWRAALSALGWSALTFALALLAAAVLQRWLLEPMNRLETHARAVMQGEFPALATNARTRELSQVLGVISRMTTRLAEAAREHYQRVCEMRESAYVDPTTGVGNQRALARELARVTSDAENYGDGALVLLRIDGLGDLNAADGMHAGDLWLSKQAAALCDALSSLGPVAGGVSAGADLARLAGATFAMVIEAPSKDFAGSLRKALSRAFAHTGVHTGIALFKTGQAADLVLSRAEQALAEAQPDALEPGETVHLRVLGVTSDNVPQTGDEKGGRQPAPRIASGESDWWAAHLADVVARGAVSLVAQPVVTVQPRRLMHREVLARVPGRDGELAAAGVFLPLAARLGLLPDFDQVVLDALIAKLAGRGAEQFAFNISLETVRAAGRVDGLAARLVDAGFEQRVIVEFNHGAARHWRGEVLEAALRFRERGVAVALDHVGSDDLDLEWLTRFGATYLKLDGGFAHRLWSDPTQQDYVRSLVALAHSLDARVIAEHIQDPASMEVLSRLRVDGVQGYAVAAPQAFD